MALPSKQEVNDLVNGLAQAAQAYSDAQDLNGYMSRVHVLEKARALTNALITPDQKPNYHGLNVSQGPFYSVACLLNADDRLYRL